MEGKEWKETQKKNTHSYLYFSKENQNGYKGIHNSM